MIKVDWQRWTLMARMKIKKKLNFGCGHNGIYVDLDGTMTYASMEIEERRKKIAAPGSRD
jgi:hypothetical protein